MKPIVTLIIFFALFQVNPALGYQSKPGVLNAHGMVYHQAESQLYIFGGATESEVSNKLMTLSGSTLMELAVRNAPSGRTFPSMTYNAKDESIFLFGGSKVLFGKGPDQNNLLNDSWVFKNGKWDQLATTNSPGARAEAAISYDEERDCIVLFGGYKIEGEDYVKLGDTWEFYEGNWHLVSEGGPSPRNGSSTIYDPIKKRTILFGGSTVNRAYGAETGETWEWNGENWQRLDIRQPPNVFNANMVFDQGNQRVLRFGGYNGSARIDEMWTLEENQWQRIEGLTTTPAARNHSQLVVDSNGNLILFGGHNGAEVFGDLWLFRNNSWEQILNTAPRIRLKNGH